MRFLAPLFVVFALFLSSCSQEPKTPEDIARAFFRSLADGDFEAAKRFAEPNTGAFLDLAAAMAEVRERTGEILGLPESDAEILGAPRQLEDGRLELPILRDGREEFITLVEKDGRWRIRLPESLF